MSPTQNTVLAPVRLGGKRDVIKRNVFYVRFTGDVETTRLSCSNALETCLSKTCPSLTDTHLNRWTWAPPGAAQHSKHGKLDSQALVQCLSVGENNFRKSYNLNL